MPGQCVGFSKISTLLVSSAAAATTTAVEWSSDEGCSVAGTVDRTGEDEPEDWLHVYLGDDKRYGTGRDGTRRIRV